MPKQSALATWRGVIDSQPMVMHEDPEHVTFRMRSVGGAFLEVFVPCKLVRRMPEVFGQGQPITITGEFLLPGQTPQTPIVVFAQSAKAA